MQIVYSDLMLMLFLYLEFLFFPKLCDSETRPLKYAVDEESKKDTYIGNIIADTNIKTNLVLTMHSADGKADRLIRLDSKSGSLFTAVVIDREKICNNQDRQCNIEAAVQVAIGIWINIFVEIKDINDHTPTFPKETYKYVLSEKVEMGYKLRLELAHDADLGLNSEISYKLQKYNSDYLLTYTKEKGIHLTVTTMLDYENKTLRKTSLRLLACDSGVPKLCGSTEILVLLTDVNDNEPHFDKPAFETLILETIAVNSIVYTFSAIDLDSGDNGKVRYSIIDSVDSIASSHFNVFENGHLRVIRSLEDINLEELKVKILAEDFGSPSLRTTCLLRIKIIDVNNHKPEIKVTLLKNTKIMENSPPGTLVALISVIDRDKGNNGITKCEQLGSNDYVFMKLENRIKNNDFYNLVTTREIDRELNNVLYISIICKDEGQPSMTGVKNLTIEIGDENEYPPLFINQNINIKIPEDTEISKTIYKLIAKDNDSTSNLTYTFGHKSNYFHLNEKSGHIIVKSKLDREDIDEFKLKCYVYDNTREKTFSSTASLTITLLDVNDNAPKLIPPKIFQVMENTPNHSTSIGQLTASDEDIGNNGIIRFEVVRIDVATGVSIKNSIMENIFQIDNTKGLISLNTPLDREEASKYKIMVRLSDMGVKSLQTEEYIEIEVMDENDNRPKFDIPFSDYNISLPVDINTPLLRIKATDMDSEKNANISYSLLSGSQFFKMNSLSGQLYASKVLQDGAFELTFQACDNGFPPSYSEVAHVRVRVWPVNADGLTIEEKERIDSLLIIIIASSTCIVFLCLLSAIIIVKWQRDPRHSNSTIKQNDEDDNDSSTLQKWTEQQNQYALSIGNQYYRPTSVMSQEMGNDECDKNIDENNMCSMFHFRYPFTQELEMSSADSGKGTIEEENIMLDLKGKCLISNRNCITLLNHYQPSMITKYTSSYLTGNSSPKSENLRHLTTNEFNENNPYQGLNALYNQPLNSSQNIPLNTFLAL